VKVILLNDVAADFRRFEARTSVLFQPARVAIRELVTEARADARNTVAAAKSGRSYGGQSDSSVYRLQRINGKRSASRFSTRFGAYRASAPGEAPASRTGVLLRAIRVSRIGAKAGQDRGFEFFVFADQRTAFYRAFLEFGTRQRRRRRGDAGRVEPRPLWTPLQQKYARLAARRVDLAVDRGLVEFLK
jgi:hypothetical protein